jgi:nucleotide-binding universal stress UspA family protein
MAEQLLYRSIAVASTFSPRFEQVLAEARRMRDRFSSELSLVYVGEKSATVTENFAAALEKLGLPRDSPIHYEQGDPATAILRAIETHAVELIVAGALEKEVVLHPFLGNVARRLLREGRHSVMLFTTPELEPKPLRKIVFVTDYSEHGASALKRTLHLAAQEKSERLYVIRMVTTFDEVRAARDASKPRPQVDEEVELERFVLAQGQIDVPTEVRYIRGNTGFAVADFVHSISADLLVVPVAVSASGGQLPSNLEWLTDVIPCNLWIIR